VIWHRRKSGCQGVAPDVQMLAIDGASSAWQYGFDHRKRHHPYPTSSTVPLAMGYGPRARAVTSRIIYVRNPTGTVPFQLSTTPFLLQNRRLPSTILRVCVRRLIDGQ